jgi:hypothetical protein
LTRVGDQELDAAAFSDAPDPPVEGEAGVEAGASLDGESLLEESLVEESLLEESLLEESLLEESPDELDSFSFEVSLAVPDPLDRAELRLSFL